VSQLNFQKDESGVMRARANGFNYLINPNAMERAYIIIHTGGVTTTDIWLPHKAAFDLCQSHANAVQSAIDGQWMSVEERLPENDTECLCSCGGSLTLTAYWNVYTKEWDVYNRGTALWEQVDVTHWRPLPAPPTPKETNGR
jgi:hypothetical protein